MNKSVVAGVIAAAAVFAGVIYFKREPVMHDGPHKADVIAPEVRKSVVPDGPGLVSSSKPPPRTAPADPRLAALMVSPDNALIEYFSDPEGRVIKEIDNDPASLGYGKPLREY